MPSAEFFDIFGFMGFVIILYIGMRLKKRKKAKIWVSNLLIIIGLLGLVIDAYFVIKTFIIN